MMHEFKALKVINFRKKNFLVRPSFKMTGCINIIMHFGEYFENEASYDPFENYLFFKYTNAFSRRPLPFFQQSIKARCNMMYISFEAIVGRLILRYFYTLTADLHQVTKATTWFEWNSLFPARSMAAASTYPVFSLG